MTTKHYYTHDFDYDLPPDLIAQFPLEKRSESRLLALNITQKALLHYQFFQLIDLLRPEDLLVFNNTKVIPARLFGHKESGGKIECLVERILSDNRILAHIRASKPPKPNSILHINSECAFQVIQRQGPLYELLCLKNNVLATLEKYATLPLPPYIERTPDKQDQSRYQTIFAKELGAVAAPTAALHFDHALMDAIKTKKIATAYVTLHIGAGTFQPVRSEILTEHTMHCEYMILDEKVCEAVTACKKRGGRVIAVGTTAVRSLETAAKKGALAPYTGETQLFIYPGFKFQCVDALITNFHLPKSTLLMLTCALGGYDFVMQAYNEAIQHHYRFFSYGDAMLLTP